MRVRKPEQVDLGEKGSFTVKHPGAFRRAAQAAGEGTQEFAREHEHDAGVTGRRARSALGFAAMRHGKRK
jgi:hypothetical protein